MSEKSYEINERLKKFAESKGFSQSELSKVMGISQQNINFIWKLKYLPGPKFLEALFCAFPELNPSWVMRGTEPMELSDVKNSIGDRIAIIMERNNLSVGSMAEMIDVTPTLLADIINGKEELPETAEKTIVKLFPINGIWLKHGRGSMLKEVQNNKDQAPISGNVQVFTLYVQPGREIMIRILPKD